MIRGVLRDAQWERVAPLLPGKVGDAGRSGKDNRRFLEAVLWVARTSAGWREIDPSNGNWNSISGPPAGHRRKRGTQNQAIGRSRGGLTTKIVALVDALGNLVRFLLLPGQRHDSVGVMTLIDGLSFGELLGDKAFDIDWLRAELDRRKAEAVIPPKANRIPCDFHKYRWRHLVEHAFCKLKAFRRIATRYDKTDASYAAMIQLAATAIALR